MDVKLATPFLNAIETVLGQFGVNDIKKGELLIKEEMYVVKDITAFIGIVGEIKGTVSYSFDTKTAISLSSAMMCGMPIESVGEMERSALAELANMITGNAVSIMNDVKDIDISPPSVVMGQDMFFVIGTVATMSVNLYTSIGVIEVNLGLEA